MTILAVVTEMEGSCITDAGSILDIRMSLSTVGDDPDYVRGALDVDQAATLGDVLLQADTYTTPAYDNGNAFWLHFDTYWNTTRDLNRVITIADSAGDLLYGFYLNIISNGSIQFTFYTYTDAGAETAVGPVNLTNQAVANTTEAVDIKIDPATDTVEFYRASTLELTLTSGGDSLDLNQRTAATQISCLCLQESIDSSLSQIILTESESTIDWKVKTLNPNGAGANTDWTGAYTDVDESGLDISQYNRTSSAGTQTYAYTDVQGAIQTGMEIAAVVPCALALAQTGATVPNITNVVRIGGVNYDLGASKDVEGNLAKLAYSTVNTVSPATAAKWTFAEVNAAEFGFKTS